MTKLKFIFIHIYNSVFPEFGMQIFSLCHEARRCGATFPHSKMILHSPMFSLALFQGGSIESPTIFR